MASHRKGRPNSILVLAALACTLLSMASCYFLIPAVICALIVLSQANTKYCLHCGRQVDAPGGCADPFVFLSIFFPEASSDLPGVVQCTACDQWGCWRCCHPHGSVVREKPLFNTLSDGSLQIADWAVFREATDFRHHACCQCHAGLLGQRYLDQLQQAAAARAAAAQAATGPGGWDVFLLAVPGDRTLVIGALTEHAGMSAAEAADVLRRLPTRVLRAARTLQAEKLEKALRRAGAQAEMRTAAP